MSVTPGASCRRATDAGDALNQNHAVPRVPEIECLIDLAGDGGISQTRLSCHDRFLPQDLKRPEKILEIPNSLGDVLTRIQAEPNECFFQLAYYIRDAAGKVANPGGGRDRFD